MTTPAGWVAATLRIPHSHGDNMHTHAVVIQVPSDHALIPLADFTKRWVCGVVRSGFHNGAGCVASDPHTGWGCSWRYEVSYSDEQWTQRTTREA